MVQYNIMRTICTFCRQAREILFRPK
jgi:hypothetical protein